MFEGLLAQSAWSASNADDPILAALPATVRFGHGEGASWRPDGEELLSTSVNLARHGVEYHLPLPGAHNLENLMAALCVCEHLGCEATTLAEAVRGFEGVARRFSVTETARGIRIVDDFAHNPAKITAAVTAARGLSRRIMAVYQPHGFGPTRFLRNEYIGTFRALFGPGDALYLLPIYYAGGTATKDISSGDIVEGLGPVPFRAAAVVDRDELLSELREHVGPGDCVLVMGARDPSLPSLVGRIIDLFSGDGAGCARAT
jgi:UDP-N-acetylmuramate--alanine ligase